jgi:hypothetical protein
VKNRYDSSIDLSRQFETAQRYYQHLQCKIIEELAACEECLVARLGPAEGAPLEPLLKTHKPVPSK